MKRKFKVNGRTYTAVLTKEGKWYVVKCYRLHSYTQGMTIKSAMRNIKEVSELMIDCDETLKISKTIKRPKILI